MICDIDRDADVPAEEICALIVRSCSEFELEFVFYFEKWYGNSDSDVLQTLLSEIQRGKYSTSFE